MVGLAQMVRASDCGPEGRWFNPSIPPHIVQISARRCFFDVHNREERTNFAGSTLFVLEVDVDTVRKNHLLDSLSCLQVTISPKFGWVAHRVADVFKSGTGCSEYFADKVIVKFATTNPIRKVAL